MFNALNSFNLSRRIMPRDEDILFLDQLGFYFANCPEVPNDAFPFDISIFRKEEIFVEQVQRLSMDEQQLATVQISQHHYDPDFPTSQQFEAFSINPFIDRDTISWIDKMNPLVLNPLTVSLRKSVFEKIHSQRLDIGYNFEHRSTIQHYIINVMDRLLVLYQFVTDNKTPLIIRPTQCPLGWGDNTHVDMRYMSDEMIADYINRLQKLDTLQLKNDYEMIPPYMKHSLEELVEYRLLMKYASEKKRHAHAVVFAYCMQKWCEYAIQTYYYDIEFYKKIRPDQEPMLIINYVCQIVIQIESIMLYVMQKTKETTTERIALNAVSPEDGAPLTTATTIIKGQTAQLRKGTVTINDVISLLHKAGFEM